MNQIDCMMRGDTLAGFQYELSTQFAYNCLHVKVKWVRVADIPEAIRLLEQGKVDLIAQNLPRSTEVLQHVAISSPILTSKAVLVQRKASEVADDDTIFVKNQLALGKKQLCIVRGSSYAQRIQHLAEEISDTIYVSEMKVHDAEELILLVAKGSVRYGVCDEKVANYFVKRFPGIDVSVDIGFPQLQGWGINKRSSGLAKAVNSWLEKFTKSDRFNLLYAKYYN
jgi:membrane-bound lytic murein transglycosylase MltF